MNSGPFLGLGFTASLSWLGVKLKTISFLGLGFILSWIRFELKTFLELGFILSWVGVKLRTFLRIMIYSFAVLVGSQTQDYCMS